MENTFQLPVWQVPPGSPLPAAIALAYGQQLVALIQQEMQAAENKLSFDRFMELALYAPGLGYYSAGSQKFGEAGDFITAPELSPLFAQCLARQCQQVFQEVNQADILEFGAGSGRLAIDLLLELEAQGFLPNHYYILEPSAELQARQHEAIQNAIPHLSSRIEWLRALPEPGFEGIILANEVVDAFPIRKFQFHEQHFDEYYVTWNGQAFEWLLAAPADEAIVLTLKELQQQFFPTAIDYEIELNAYLTGWINSLSALLKRGLILIIDYGFPKQELYHPDRQQGTLMCHYRHRTHSNPLVLPGLQDITTHVDFTAIAEAAVEEALEIAGYTTQAAFLLSCGIMDMASAYQEVDTRQRLHINQQIKRLTMPHEMGELFKVMALTRELTNPLLGFELRDFRGRL